MEQFRTLGLMLLLAPILFASACSTPDEQYIVYVGTYTGHGSDGIYAYRFDPVKGDMSSIGLVARTENPSFFTIDPDGRFLYAVNEIDTFQHASSGAISVFAIHRESGKLDLLQQIPSLGAGPAHLSLDRSGRHLLVANYGGGNVSVFPKKEDGTLGPQTSFIQDTGSGPNTQRQAGPHAHFIGVAPDNRYAMVADLGIDKVLVYQFDAIKGSLKPSDMGSVALNPGDGPRHIAFAPSGKFIYVVNELTSTVTTFSFEPETGKMLPLKTLSTLPEDFSGSNTTAEILIDAKGQYLYVSNRGDDSIVVFNIDSDGKLIPVEWISTGGKGPRHFEIDPTGQWLFVANQNSNSIKLFRVDQASGRLIQTEKAFNLVSPVCIGFVSMEIDSP
jgi:6-phosphogluconolactonase